MTVVSPETLGLAPAEQDMANTQDQVNTLWDMVLAGTLGYSAFITIASEIVTTANLTAWALADIAVTEAVLAGTDIPVEPIGYSAPAWLTDPRRLERQIALMLNTADSAEVRALREQKDVTAAHAAQDDLRARKLLRLVDNETATAYASSEGIAIQTFGQTKLVKGWIRELAAPKVYASRAGKGSHRGGAGTAPCTWCITLNGGNAVRPWYFQMGRHDADRCRRQPVIVPLDQIGHLWQGAYARRLRIAQDYVSKGDYGLRFEPSPLTA